MDTPLDLCASHEDHAVEHDRTATPEHLTSHDAAVVAALRRGDEAAFLDLVEQHHAALVRVALCFVGERAIAEEVAQETWLAVIRGLDRFAGRGSLKGWIFRILVNRARSRAVREARSLSFSALTPGDDDADEPAVAPERFLPPGHPDAGWWAVYPRDWSALPEERLLAAEVRALVQERIATLPPNQRAVIALRDVAGWTADEVCVALGLSAANQRVLLHRARARVRAALERYLDEEASDAER